MWMPAFSGKGAEQIQSDRTMAKQYTLTKKGSIRGPIEKNTKNPKYAHQRGDVIDENQFEKLIDRHKNLFKEGAISMGPKPSAKETAQDEIITNLVERVEQLEAQVKELTEQKATSKANPPK